jgi:hypothetical protein
MMRQDWVWDLEFGGSLGGFGLVMQVGGTRINWAGAAYAVGAWCALGGCWAVAGQVYPTPKRGVELT